MIKFSVVVPIYNVERFLPKCIESIIYQTYRDLEIILVNDGSPDHCLQIAERYAEKDDRIKVISQDNGGLSAARNTGLSAATGEYVSFIDSDDWIEPDMFEELVSYIHRYPADIVCFRLQFDNLVLNKQTVYGRTFDCVELVGDTILKDTLLVKNIPTAVWAKIYRRDFLLHNQLWFEPGIVNEDTLFSIQTACCAERVGFVDHIFYHAIEREGSISRSSQERLFLDMVVALDKARDYMILKGKFSDLEFLYKARYLKSLLYNILQIGQRLDYKNYLRIYRLCMENSVYRQYNKRNIRKQLSYKHRTMLSLSKYPALFYLGVKVLNFFSFRMH